MTEFNRRNDRPAIGCRQHVHVLTEPEQIDGQRPRET